MAQPKPVSEVDNEQLNLIKDTMKEIQDQQATMIHQMKTFTDSINSINTRMDTLEQDFKDAKATNTQQQTQVSAQPQVNHQFLQEQAAKL